MAKVHFFSRLQTVTFTYSNPTLIKTEYIIGIAALGLLALGFINKAVALGTLNFYPDKINSISFLGGTPVMTISLLVQNTSSQSFNIKSISGNVYTNNTLIGNISSFTTQLIAPNSQSYITIQVRLMLVSLTNDIIRAFQFGNFSQTIKLNASINVDDYQIPLNTDFQIGNKISNAA